MHTRDFRRLAYFAQIVESGSIRGAAQRLNVSPPVVSTALADLEADVGVTLFRRAHNALQVTAEGETMYQHALAMRHAAERALSSVSNPAHPVHGTITVTVSGELGLFWLPPLLSGFSERYPGVTVIVHAMDELVDMDSSDVDLAIRARHSDTPWSRDDAVASLPVELVCAPHLLSRSRTTLRQRLAHIPFIGFTRRENSGEIRAFDRRTGRVTRIAVTPRIFVNSGYAAREFARLGFGAAWVLTPSVMGELNSGTLVRLSDRHHFGYAIVTLHLRDRLPSAATRAFSDFITDSVSSDRA